MSTKALRRDNAYQKIKVLQKAYIFKIISDSQIGIVYNEYQFLRFQMTANGFLLCCVREIFL